MLGLALASTPTLLVVIAIMFLAAAVNAAAGFGYTLIAIPLCSLVLTPHDVVIAAFCLSSLTGGLMAHDGKKNIVWADAWILTGWAALGMPVGALILLQTSPATLRIILGLAIFGALALLHLVDRRGSPWRVTWWLRALTGGASGVLNTALAANGPPLALYLRGVGRTPDEFKATISFVFSTSNVVGVVVYLATGAFTKNSLVVMALGAVPVILGFMFGRKIAKSIPAHAFNHLVMGLLALSAAVVLLKGLLGA